MTAQEPATRRSIILTCDSDFPGNTAACRLLSQLGHDVTPVATADSALILLQEDRIDLVVVDLDSPAQVDYVHRLVEDLPPGQQPKQIVVFSDRMDPDLAELRRRVSPARLHVFLKPLHLHGLLGLLRQIDLQSESATA